jgi:hypothetical protein
MRLLSLLTILLATTVVAAPLVDDQFTAAQLAGRDLSPTRGIWKIAEGAATCTQDDALYTKNKNHGPILWYDAAFTDATIRFAIRASGAKQFVFTLNDDKGHVFRYVLGQTPLAVRAWKESGHDAKPDVLPVKDGPKLTDGAWIPAELKFTGDRCSLKLGDGFAQDFQHPAIARKKTRLGLGFAFGTLSVRDVSVVTP